MKPLRTSLLVILIEILAKLTDQVESLPDQPVLELHVVVQVRGKDLLVFVAPVQSQDINMQKGIVSSECDTAGFLLDHQLLVALLVLGLDGFLVGGEVDLGVGVEKQIALDEVGLQVLHHRLLGFRVVDLLFGFL